MTPAERTARIHEYDRQIENFEKTQLAIAQYIAEIEILKAYWVGMEDDYAKDIADLKACRAGLTTVDGRMPGFKNTNGANGRRAKPRKVV